VSTKDVSEAPPRRQPVPIGSAPKAPRPERRRARRVAAKAAKAAARLDPEERKARFEAQRLMLESAASSGLSPFVAKGLFEPLSGQQVIDMGVGYGCAAYRINYYLLDGSIDPLFYRLRFVGEDAPDFRYWQPKDTLPRLYLPPLPDRRNWESVAKDPQIDIWLTEGERKSAIACLKDLACIGLGGVFNFKSKKAGALPLIRDFKAINWKGRKVFFVYDAEVAARSDLLSALRALADELTKLGAHCYQVDLPPVQDKKVGLDDYLLDNSIDDLLALPREEIGGVLWQLNKEYAVLRSPAGQILRLRDGEVIDNHSFTRVEVADRQIQKLGPRGLVEVNGGEVWLEWPERKVIERVVFEPGRERPTYTIDGLTYYNRWKGLAVEPAESATDEEVAPFIELVDRVFDGIKPEHREWLLSWFASPLQRPQIQVTTAVGVSGDHHIGKTLIAKLIGGIYGLGRGYASIGPSELFDPFNGWLLDKEFVGAHELRASDKKESADRLKHIIDGEEVTINPKYGRRITVPNRARFYITSNHPDFILLDETERRYFIHNSAAKAMTKTEVNRVIRWRDNGGLSKLLHWLLYYPIPKSFDPGNAPTTDAQIELAETGLTDLQSFAREIVRNPYETLWEPRSSETAARAPKIDLWDMEQIMDARRLRHPQRDTTEHALGNALRDTRKIWRTNFLVKGRNRRKRVWVVARFDEWREAARQRDLKTFAYEYQRHTLSKEVRPPKRFPPDQKQTQNGAKKS
jgi:hypothetical protein